MFKKTAGLLLVLIMVLCAASAGAASAGRQALSVLSEEPSPTSAPTETPAPTEAPTETPTEAPTAAPTDEPLAILTASLKNGRVGVEYSQQLEANYGDAVFSIYNSSSGPNQFDETGLSLSSEGLISGVPKAAGSFTFYVKAKSGSTGTEVRAKFKLTIERGATAAPTATPRPTSAPGYTSAPTARPYETPQYVTQGPTAAPTQPGNYIAYPLWERAAETVQRFHKGSYINLALVEGVSGYLSFSDLYGNLPAGCEFVNDFSASRSLSLRGAVEDPGSYEFALAFNIRGGARLMLNFRITVTGEESAPAAVEFPQGNPLVPFGAPELAPAAMLPECAGYRRNKEAV